MENKNLLDAELKLTKQLLLLVNSKEEYEFLLREEARLSSLFSKTVKGGTRKW